MLRHSPPVAIPTGRQSRARSAQSRPSRTTLGRNGVREETHARDAEHPSPLDLGLGHLFQHTREAIVVGELATGRITLWNPAAERLFGYSAAEVVGQPIEMLMPPPIAQLHTDGLNRFRRTGQASRLLGFGTAIEVPALGKDGQELRVELLLVPIETQAGPPRYVAAMLRDASDRRRAELLERDAARAEMARQVAERALDERDQLLLDATARLQHEVSRLQRTTARLSRSLADAPPAQTLADAPPAQSRADAAPAQSRADDAALLVRLTTGRTGALARRVEQLADSVALQAGALEIRPERVNLVPLVTRLVAEARERCPLHRVRLAAPQGLTAQVDAARLERVIRQLLDQAFRRNPRGGWVDVELRRPLVGLARLEIRDYGRPVPAAMRERLQSPSRTDWLAVVRHVVDLHGGTTAIEFPEEGGIRVVLILPTQHARVTGGAL
jgi:PAS domain S-box-containing protein